MIRGTQDLGAQLRREEVDGASSPDYICEASDFVCDYFAGGEADGDCRSTRAVRYRNTRNLRIWEAFVKCPVALFEKWV